jgi:excisionase family DNA binding protein
MNNYLTEKELMQSLKVSRSTLVRWRKEGMPFEKIGKLIRYNEEKIMDWLEGKGVLVSVEIPENTLKDAGFLKEDGTLHEYEVELWSHPDTGEDMGGIVLVKKEIERSEGK